ncbi:hypothetical protein PIB30_017310 [Stylosanthes scabra]|uniref:Aminotransferase-like plant mobile domain-containing protein n=1 Tax=Stylosanthes scabra TaxID=79078 RepID=A0ABU6S8X7_9FABA|nr:hypothetical protein [Stylosanthes scabra]
MAQPTLEEVAADRNIMYRLDAIAHVAHDVNRLPIRCLNTVRRQHPMYLDPRAEPYLDRGGCSHLLGFAMLGSSLPVRVDDRWRTCYRCLYEFETLMPDGRGRQRWDWFREIFGVIPPPKAADSCTVTFSWLTAMSGVVPEDATEIQICRHAHAYIMLLLSTQLFGGKTAARVPIRWIPFLDQLDDLGQYSWGPLQLLQSLIFWRFSSLRPYGFDQFRWPLATRWERYLPTSDEKDPRVLQYRTRLDRLTHRDVRMIPQFGGVQNHPHRPLNNDWLHARDGRWGDRWWYLAARRFLAPDDAFYLRPLDEIPPKAILRVADTPAGGTQVDDVPYNRHPGRRRMVGTRTTDRDWQWLDEMIGDEAATPRRVRHMPEDGGRRGGRGEDGGEAGSLHLSPMVVRAALIRHGLVSRASSTPVFGSPSQDFMVGLNIPGFQRTLQQLMVDDMTYRPEFDGRQVQVHMDLNEPASAPSHLFTAYVGTLASAYMQDAHFMDPYPVPPPERLPATDDRRTY